MTGVFTSLFAMMAIRPSKAQVETEFSLGRQSLLSARLRRRRERGDTMIRSHHFGFRCVQLVFSLAGMVATAVQAESEPSLSALRSGERSLLVGGVSEYTPFNVVGPDGQLTGMDREIIRAAAKRLGIKQVDCKTMTFSKLGQSLLDGKIDVIAN